MAPPRSMRRDQEGSIGRVWQEGYDEGFEAGQGGSIMPDSWIAGGTIIRPHPETGEPVIESLWPLRFTAKQRYELARTVRKHVMPRLPPNGSKRLAKKANIAHHATCEMAKAIGGLIEKDMIMSHGEADSDFGDQWNKFVGCD